MGTGSLQSILSMPPQLFCRLLLTFLLACSSWLHASVSPGLCSCSYDQERQECCLQFELPSHCLGFNLKQDSGTCHPYKYSSFLCSNPLQFGFKPSFSTTLCTGVVKNVISHYIHNGSCVHCCFLDASKAFDLVDHNLFVCQAD